MGAFPGYPMKVVCDNCRAVYKVPDDKLTKAVNKATCRNCGHRMLIPRPKPNADPEERTLVTAVPPTPVGAPPRGASHAREEREESTLPGRPTDDLHVETPIMAPRIGDTVPGPEEDFDGVDTRIKTSADQTTVKPTAAPARPAASARGPASNPPPPQRRATPPPAPLRSAPPPPASVPTQQHYASAPQPPAPRRTPAPPPQRAARATPAPAAQRSFSATGTPLPAPNASYNGTLHDPANDLNWALLGTSMALIGGVLLSILSIFNHPLVMWFGLAMTFGGGILSFLVLLTGARGRRPAQTLLSVVLGFVISVTLASLLVGTKWGAEKVIDAYDIQFGNSAEALATASPVAASATPTPAPAPAADGAVAPVPEEEVVIVPNPAPAKAAKGQPERPAPAPAPAPSSSRQQPQPVAAQPPPRPAPAPSGPALVSVPIEVVHTMVSNNIEVKRCFVPLYQSGSLPPRVDASFQISPVGRAGSVTLAQPQYRGSQLEGCIARAIGSIQFPPAQQGTSLSYPFILQ
jgi:predicted Zn finger-like uncharacterized protein